MPHILSIQLLMNSCIVSNLGRQYFCCECLCAKFLCEHGFINLCAYLGVELLGYIVMGVVLG